MTITEKKLQHNALTRYLIERIQTDGPMDMYTYMQLCLTHSKHGYYAQKAADTIFGKTGDFVTSPEISPLFAEMIALWVVMQWECLKRPKVLNLLELGPGSGALMHGVLSTLDKLPSFTAKCNVYFVEINPDLKAVQASKCDGFADIFHHDDLGFLPKIKAPVVAIANEFLDVLPVQQYVRIQGEYSKNSVSIGADGNLVLTTLPISHIPGSLEEQPDIPLILEQLYSHMQQWGGSALIVDYGYWKGSGHTLQAVYQHQKVDILERPGEVDLSAHVNFQLMAKQSELYGLQYSYRSQRQFLMDYGIQLRLHQLCESSNDVVRRRQLLEGVRRLIDPAQMGHLFKVLSVNSI